MPSAASAGATFGAAIHDAAKNGDAARIKELLEQSADWANAPDDDGKTAMHWAAAGGRILVSDLANNRIVAFDASGREEVAASGDRGAFLDLWQTPVGMGHDVGHRDAVGDRDDAAEVEPLASEFFARELHHGFRVFQTPEILAAVASGAGRQHKLHVAHLKCASGGTHDNDGYGSRAEDDE